jgi:hypothetical protein
MRSQGVFRSLALLLASSSLCFANTLHAQGDGGVTPTDGGGTGVLESIYVPNFPNAPFTLTLRTEWIQTMQNGGTFTLVNARPIMRDRAGRIYMERWGLVPKGTDIKSAMTTIQVDDPIAHLFYQCHVREKVCELLTSLPGIAHYDPTGLKSGPLKSGKGTFLHEDLGEGTFAGVPIHAYRDTTTLDAGTLGNDLPMATMREFRYSAELGFNLTSVLEAAQVGRQIFTVDDLSTNEPDPRFFQAPEGYKIIDKRPPPKPKQ